MTERTKPGALLVRGNDVKHGEVVAIAPNGDTWKYAGLRVIRLGEGSALSGETGDKEIALVMISGSIDVETSQGNWSHVGKRADPFSGPPEAVYLPAGTSYGLQAMNAAEVAVCSAPSRGQYAARHIALPVDAGYIRGEGQARRRIFDILMNDEEAGSLFLTEVVTFPGNWSSYPPHKHDEDNLPTESQLEELYYYRAQPREGFAFQRVYTANSDFDETMTVRDTDVVMVPRGYHACAAAAGYWIYYLNVLAGPKHVYRMSFDPAHAWIKEGWTW